MKRTLPEQLKNFLRQMFFSNKTTCRLSTPQEVISAMSPLRPINNGFELIRVGGNGDGGYLVPNDLDGIAACFSPGVGNSSEFELDLVHSYGITCFLSDFSVDKPQVAEGHIHFEKKFVGSAGQPNFVLLDEWVRANSDLNHPSDLILQMDIEGWEYDTIIHAKDETLKRFRIITIELHHLDRLFIKSSIDLYASIFRKLTRFHDVVHIHPNNQGGLKSRGNLSIPRLLEVTLHRKDRAKCRLPRTDFPHRYDKDNCSNDFVELPRWMYEVSH